MNPGVLSPESRNQALAAMAAEELDILVIGGGVVGAGVALDAASRGLRVGIVEARDWASGTSSRSSKLIHGGLRYLEMLDFRLVFESLRERGLLVATIAPHLVHPVEFLYPLTHRVWERAYVGAGVLLYDALAILGGRRKGLPLSRHLSRRGALRVFPGLSPRALVGAVRYSDAQVDDARHTMTVVRTAVAQGAFAANRARVSAITRSGDTVTGAEVVDQETGDHYSVRAKRVINAGGVWTDQLQDLAGTDAGFTVRASKGVHIVVARDRIAGDAGLILRTEKSVLFVIPWGKRWFIGTTDTDWSLDLVHPSISGEDIEYLLKRVNTVLASPLTLADVEGVYAGLRPLVGGENAETSKLSREHHVSEPLQHFVVIAGGKYTTYRIMAKDAVDIAVRGLPAVPASRTVALPLLGAEGFGDLWATRGAFAARAGVPVERIEHLLHRYGSMAHELLALIERDASLGQPLPGGWDYLRAEVVYAVTHEGARHLDDVLARRTRLSIESKSRGVDAAEVAAELMRPLLGWSADDRELEVERYRERVAAERAAETEPDDVSSETARLAAPEIVPPR
jgi:glycerol-3-phosphate dehydrogenase